MFNLANWSPLPSKSDNRPLLREFSLLKLQSLEDIVRVVEILRRGKIAIIMLTQLEAKTSQRVMDWLNGYILAQGGLSQWLGEQTYLLASAPIDLTGSFPSLTPNHSISVNIKKVLLKLDEHNLLTLVFIPGGSLIMGAEPEETPVHSVQVPGFYLSQYPITQAQWRAVAALPMVNQSLDPNPAYFVGDNLPVEQVSWYDAVEFSDRLSRAMGREYRLPSEAEWEYACRAGTRTEFWFGQNLNSDLANYDAHSGYGTNPERPFLSKTTPVDYFGIHNPFGLADLHGNVWEWCQDHWHRDYQDAPTDGSAWLSEDEQQLRVIRGGSWDDLPRFCRSASRYALDPQRRVNNVGFRIACTTIG